MCARQIIVLENYMCARQRVVAHAPKSFMCVHVKELYCICSNGNAMLMLTERCIMCKPQDAHHTHPRGVICTPNSCTLHKVRSDARTRRIMSRKPPKCTHIYAPVGIKKVMIEEHDNKSPQSNFGIKNYDRELQVMSHRWLTARNLTEES